MPKNSSLRDNPYWRSVLDTTEDLIFIKDKESKIVDANQAFFDLYNAKSEDIIGQTTFESYPEDEREHFMERDRDAFIAGQARSDIQLTAEKTGDVYYYDMQKTRFEHDGKAFLYCSGRNITEPKKYALTMERVARVLSSSEKATEKLESILAIGNEYFGTEHGIISHVVKSSYTVIYAESEAVSEGDVFILGETFCDLTIHNERLTHACDTSKSMFSSHPCLEAFKLGCYIGVPVYVNNMLYGTLNFSGADSRKKDFSEYELKFMELLRERVSFSLSEIEHAKALQSSQEMFKQALESAAHGMAIVDLSGRWMKVNKSLCQMLDYSEDEFMQMDFQTITYEEDLELDLKLVRDCISGKRDKYTMEKRYIKKGGKTIWGLLSVAIVRDEAGVPQFFISQIQDIDARHQYETQMIEMSGQLQSILDTAEDGIVTVNGYGEIQSFNKAAEQMFGYKAVEMIGENITKTLEFDDAIYLAGRIKDYFLTGTKEMIGKSRTLTGLKKNGEHIPFEVRISEIYNHGQDNALYSAILRDSTLRIEAEKNLERYNMELKRSNEELENFARVASHDLREPLRGIYNFSQFLKEDYEDTIDEAGIKRLDDMMGMTKRMEGILSGLFDYAKIGRMEDAVVRVNLENLVDLICLDMKSLMSEKGADVEFSGEKHITSYGVLMDMVMRNLIANGLKYNASESPKVTVEHSEDMDTHQIVVKDNGIGIPKEHLETVFQPFKRLESRDSDFGEGSGMGLAFVQKAVANMGGYVKVSSTVGEGTTFTIQLPQTPVGLNGANNVCWLEAPR